jgi:hypothetical protein
VRGGNAHIELVMLTAHTAAYLLGLLLVMSPLKALTFIAIHQAVWGLYMGCTFAPNHKGMPIIGAHEKLDYWRRKAPHRADSVAAGRPVATEALRVVPGSTIQVRSGLPEAVEVA